MTKIALSAGHSPLVPGAAGSGLQEHVVARAINAEMIKQAAVRGYEPADCSSNNVNGRNEVVNDAIALVNKSGASIAIQNHLNAGGGKGVEVFYWRDAGADTKNTAAKISANIANHFGWENRGAKKDTQSKAGSLGFITRTNCTAYLIEWGFIDNASDMQKLMADIPGGVKAALNAVITTQENQKGGVQMEYKLTAIGEKYLANALAGVGKKVVPNAMCLKTQRELAGIASKYGGATGSMNNTTIHKYDINNPPPIGAPIYWAKSYGDSNGHIVCYIGNGNMVTCSNGSGKLGTMKVDEWTRRANATAPYWGEEINDVAIIKKVETNIPITPKEEKTEDTDMTEMIIWIEDDHAGYGKGLGCYFSPATGVIPLESPDSINLMNEARRQEGKGPMPSIKSSSKAPWVIRAQQCSMQSPHSPAQKTIASVNLTDDQIKKMAEGVKPMNAEEIAKAVNDNAAARMKA